MCICIYKTSNGNLSKERLEQSYNANPDGWGILFIDRYKRLSYVKDITDFCDFFSNYYNVINYQFSTCLIHFRTASAAGIGEKYCHPHFINRDLAFIHNGNFYEFSSYFKGRKKDGKTDTIRFNEEILQKLPENFLENQKILRLLNDYCKYHLSKMIFMNDEGKIWIVNEDAGEWKDDCWFSNKGLDNYQGYGYSGAYEYCRNDIRHKGGLPTIQFIDKKRRKGWRQCYLCNGWYKLNNIIFTGDNICDYLCNGCYKLYQLKKFIKGGDCDRL